MARFGPQTSTINSIKSRISFNLFLLFIYLFLRLRGSDEGNLRLLYYLTFLSYQKMSQSADARSLSASLQSCLHPHSQSSYYFFTADFSVSSVVIAHGLRTPHTASALSSTRLPGGSSWWRQEWKNLPSESQGIYVVSARRLQQTEIHIHLCFVEKKKKINTREENVLFCLGVHLWPGVLNVNASLQTVLPTSADVLRLERWVFLSFPSVWMLRALMCWRREAAAYRVSTGGLPWAALKCLQMVLSSGS